MVLRKTFAMPAHHIQEAALVIGVKADTKHL